MRLFSFCVWCGCIFLLVLAQLKSVEENEGENQHILDLIFIIDGFTHIKNLAIFSGNVRSEKSFEVSKSLEQRLTESFTRPVIAIGSNIKNILYLKNDRNTAIVYFRDFQDYIFEVVSQSVSNMPIGVFIFVCKSQDNSQLSKSAMEYFFTWCWEKNITFSLLVFKRNNKFEVWVYEMKPKLEIFNFLDYMPKHWHKKGFRYFRNMKQYRFLVTVHPTLPDSFVFNSAEQHDLTGTNLSLGGRTGYFIAEFLRFANGTMEIVSISSEECYNVSTQMKYKGRTIDISSILISNVSGALFTPVVTTTRTCLALPYEGHVSAIFLQISKWSLTAFMLFYFLINTVIRRLNNPRMPMSQVLYWNQRLFFMQPMEGRYFQRLGLPTKFIEISTQIFNVLILSIFCGALTVTLTLGLRKSKIVDVESFLDSELQIMVYGNHIHTYFEVNRLPMSLTDRFLIVDERTRNEHLNALNDSYAYVIEENKWDQLKYMQTRLRKPKLKLAPSSLCGVQIYKRLPLRPVLPVIFGLRWFINYVKESGLSDKWMMLGLRQAQQAGMLVQAPYDPFIMRPLQLKFFGRGITFLLMGLMLSSTVFVMELVYVRMSRRFRNTEIAF